MLLSISIKRKWKCTHSSTSITEWRTELNHNQCWTINDELSWTELSVCVCHNHNYSTLSATHFDIEETPIYSCLILVWTVSLFLWWPGKCVSKLAQWLNKQSLISFHFFPSVNCVLSPINLIGFYFCERREGQCMRVSERGQRGKWHIHSSIIIFVHTCIISFNSSECDTTN